MNTVFFDLTPLPSSPETGEGEEFLFQSLLPQTTFYTNNR
jgi:hypothetical protein